MKTTRKAGILEIGNLDSLNGEPGVILRTTLGEEITIPLLKEEAASIGKEGLLYQNVTATISITLDTETT